MAKLDDDVNALFKLPLNEFIAARKTLAAQLKNSGHAVGAERVKLLAKPSVSAWTVNQLYWNHREPFDELMASGQRFRKAQTSGKIREMRAALDARREALSHLSELASALLSDAPDDRHDPSLDTIRRITSTLEAVSAAASLDGATLGRLTKDIDPPGFESFASVTGAAGFTGTAGVPPAKAAPARVPSPKSKAPGPKLQSQISEKKTQVEKAHQQNLAAAKASLQNAKRSLTEARARAQSLAPQQKKAEARAREAEKRQREAEKESREAEERFKQVSSRAVDASRRARTVRDEMEEAKETLADAQRTVEKATRELESLFRSTR